MIRSPDTQTQLQAMANAVDRANRPAGLVMIAAVLVGVALIFALWSGARMLNARARLQTELAGRQQVGEVLAKIAMRRQDTPDLDTLFPRNVFFAENLNDIVLQVWDVTKENQTSLPVRVGNREGPTPLAGNALLGKTEVNVSMQGQPLEKVMAFLDAVQKAPKLNDEQFSTFVSSINLRPIGVGWTADIRFVTYEKLGR